MIISGDKQVICAWPTQDELYHLTLCHCCSCMLQSIHKCRFMWCRYYCYTVVDWCKR